MPETSCVASASVVTRLIACDQRVRKPSSIATVEIQAGPHRILALTTREAVEELRLRPGMRAVAAVKATNVIVEVTA